MTNIERIRQLRALQLKHARAETNLTQGKLAKLSGLSRDTIIRLESGVKSCNQDSELIYLDTIKTHLTLLSMKSPNANPLKDIRENLDILIS